MGEHIKRRVIDALLIVFVFCVLLGVYYAISFIQFDRAFHAAITRQINAEKDAAVKQLPEGAKAAGGGEESKGGEKK